MISELGKVFSKDRFFELGYAGVLIRRPRVRHDCQVRQGFL